MRLDLSIKVAGTLRVPSARIREVLAFRGLRHMECAYYFVTAFTNRVPLG